MFRRQASTPVAVCHIHRRRGVLWRDILQSSLDPEAGFGERLISDGFATIRKEQWWPTNPNSNSAKEAAAAAPTTTKSADDAKSTAMDGDDFQQSLSAPKRFQEDLKRFVAAEEDARREKRGIWGLPQDEAPGGQSAVGAADRGDGGAMKGLSDRVARVVRAVTGLFGR